MGESVAGMRPYRVEYVQLRGWEADVVGLWLAENEEWLLLKYIPADYVVDGFVLIAKQHITARKPGKGRTQKELVLKLKGIKTELPSNFEFSDTPQLLRWTEHHCGLVHFMEEERSAFLGWINEMDVVHFWIDTLEPNGTMAAREPDELPFVFNEIQLIIFNDDYSQSLRLLWQHKSNQRLLNPSDN